MVAKKSSHCWTVRIKYRARGVAGSSLRDFDAKSPAEAKELAEDALYQAVGSVRIVQMKAHKCTRRPARRR